MPGEGAEAHSRGGEGEEGEEEVLHLEAAQEQMVTVVWLHGSGLHSGIRHELMDDVAQVIHLWKQNEIVLESSLVASESTPFWPFGHSIFNADKQ